MPKRLERCEKAAKEALTANALTIQELLAGVHAYCYNRGISYTIAWQDGERLFKKLRHTEPAICKECGPPTDNSMDPATERAAAKMANLTNLQENLAALTQSDLKPESPSRTIADGSQGMRRGE